MRNQVVLVATLALIYLLVWLTPPNHPFQALDSYLPLHSFLEFSAIAVNFLVFGVSWNAYSRERAGNLIILACALLAVGLVDFAHLFSYTGMPDFITPSSTEKAIYFWLVGRSIMAGALLWVSLSSWRTFSRPQTRYAVLVGALLGVAAVYWTVMRHLGILPLVFVEGQGLTALKVGWEYLLIIVFAVAGVRLGYQASRGENHIIRGLAVAALVSVLSELCFTLYSSVTDIFNLLGHVYKIAAALLIYRFVFVASVQEPFELLEKSRRQALLEREHFEQVVQSAPHAMIAVAGDGRIMMFNVAAERLFGYGRDDVLDRSVEMLLPEDERSAHSDLRASFSAAPDERSMNTGKTFHARRHDGELVPVEIGLSPLRTDQGMLVLASIVDVSERLQIDKEIRRINAELEDRVAQRTVELEEANKELDAFNYSVSHDLKAPLRAICGFSKIVLKDSEGKLDEASAGYLNKILASGERMDMIIDDLLTLSNVSRQEMHRQEIDLTQSAYAMIDTLVEAHPGHKVKVTVKAGMGCHGDPGLLLIVLENLFGNAWKFTERTGNAEIEFGCDERDGEAVYFVRDNGAGFNSKYAGKLFLPFQRLHNDVEFKGTGIGLSIVERIIARHGGRIWAEGDVGKGATFYFVLG